MRWRILVVACAVASALVSVDDAQAVDRGPDRACDRSPADLVLRSPYLKAEGPLLEIAGRTAPYTYLLHVPAALPSTDVPLLIALHGLGGSSAQLAAQSRLADTADEHGFIVAFPNGPRKWDFHEGSTDVAFVRSVVADVRATRCIDSRRIWATGHSMGGFMTQRLACDAGDLFAAGASLAGGNVSMPVLGGSCDAGTAPEPPPPGYEPVALGLWHGTADQLISYEQQSRTTLRLWVDRYDCDTAPGVTALPHGTREVYGGCDRPDVVALGAPLAQRFAVELRTYAGHRHGYPDGCGGLGETSLAPCTPDPERWPTAEHHNAEIHRFLSAHPRRSPAGGGA